MMASPSRENAVSQLVESKNEMETVNEIRASKSRSENESAESEMEMEEDEA